MKCSFKLKVFFNVALVLIVHAHTFLFGQSEHFSMRVLAEGLDSPWEITYGPHDSLWVTENTRYLVKRISTGNGKSTLLLDLSKEKNFTAKNGKWPQGGLMGMALHPSLYNKAVHQEKPWVYLAYVYDRPQHQPCVLDPSYTGPCYFKTKIVRYEYAGNALIHPVTIIDNLPGSNDHNSGRLVIGGEEGNSSNGRNALYLYYSIGDMGAGQFNNMQRQNNAQNIDILEGKILRFNLEPDSDRGLDAWIPNNNPFYNPDTINARDCIFSYGHRNPQGLVWAGPEEHKHLYSAEHGPQSDDEVNIIVKGGNYGWNRIAGYRDGNYDGLKLGGFSPIDEIHFGKKTVDPILSLFPAERSKIQQLNKDSFTWPSVAPSSIDYYTSDAIPDWKNSLLVTTLKAAQLYRFKLNAAGDGMEKVNGGLDSLNYFHGDGRFRDLAISPDGTKIYLACDKGGPALGKNKVYNKDGSPPPHAGTILEFTYTGNISSSKTSTPASK